MYRIPASSWTWLRTVKSKGGPCVFISSLDMRFNYMTAVGSSIIWGPTNCTVSNAANECQVMRTVGSGLLSVDDKMAFLRRTALWLPDRRYPTKCRAAIVISAMGPLITYKGRSWWFFGKGWAVYRNAGPTFFPNIVVRRWAQLVANLSKIKKIIFCPALGTTRASASKVSVRKYDNFTTWRSSIFGCWNGIRRRAKMFMARDVAVFQYAVHRLFCCKEKQRGPASYIFVSLRSGSSLFILFECFGTSWSMYKVLGRFL